MCARASAFALSALFVLGCAASPPLRPEKLARRDYSYAKARVTWLVQQLMADGDIQGLSLALVDDQEVVWQQGFGFADVARQLPATPDTVYQVASLSKLFTATAAMQLVDQGRLSLDAPLSQALPGFSMRTRFPDAPPVTLRSLLTHHSGLPADYFAGFILPDPLAPGAERRFLSLPAALRDEYVAAPPGTSFAYSNLSLSLVGAAVAQANGGDFAGYVQTALLDPLGMKHSSFRRADVASVLSRGYVGRSRVVEAQAIRDVPAAGLFSTAADLAQFVKMVLAGGEVGEVQLLQPQTLSAMLTPQNADVPLDGGILVGLGFHLTTAAQGAPARLLAGHSGDLAPFHAWLGVLPDERLGFVVLANSEGASMVLERITRTALRLAREAKQGIELPLPEAPKPMALPDDKLDALTGVYAHSFGVVDVERHGGRLTFDLLGRTLSLFPREDGSFGVQYRLLGAFPLPIPVLAEMRVEFGEDGGERRLHGWIGGSAFMQATRIRPHPVPAAWRARVGKYVLVDPGERPIFAEPELVWDDARNLLLLRVKVTLFDGLPVALALRALSDTEAITEGVGRNAGETLRAEGEILRYSGLRMKPDR